MSSGIKGVVLSGGEGARLRPLSFYIQKCMMPVGRRQKPVLEYVVRLFVYNKIPQILMLTGYKHEQIENYFGDGRRFGAEITYVLDDPNLQGTGGSLINAYRSGLLSSSDLLFIHYGDILSDIDLRDTLSHHKESGNVATLAVAEGYQMPVGVVEVENNYLKDFVEKPTLAIHVGIGILVLDGSTLDELDILCRNRQTVDLMGDLLPNLVRQGKSVGAYLTQGKWYDVGSIEKYEKLDNSFVEELDRKYVLNGFKK